MKKARVLGYEAVTDDLAGYEPLGWMAAIIGEDGRVSPVLRGTPRRKLADAREDLRKVRETFPDHASAIVELRGVVDRRPFRKAKV